MGGEVFVMAISLIFLCATFQGVRKSRAFRRVAIRTQGEVTHRNRYQTSSGSGNTRSVSYKADLNIRYRTVDGREVVGAIEGMDGMRAPKVGRTVQILYNPNDTSQIQIDTMLGRGTCLYPPLLLVLTAVFVISTVALIRTLTG